ncbi:hypothetical protein DVH24_030970 [Malus domestica]|uniref:Wall-associated receptor kinase galacturonan-binding domain-containing protein n=1 Tax=Malus domestica TaxID=3750 RepID=A0A498HH27_MALDO|nr:hypothetical protein DVH24_030970 [Malus domestica]
MGLERKERASARLNWTVVLDDISKWINVGPGLFNPFPISFDAPVFLLSLFFPTSIMHFFLLQSLFPFLLIASFLSINVELSLCQNDQQFINYSSDINCGGVGGIYYPFWGVNRASYCGQPGYEVQCLDNVPVFNMTGASYRILQMNTTTNSWKVKVARHDYWDTICPWTFVNTTLNFSPV